MLTNGTITLRDRRDVFDDVSVAELAAVWDELQTNSVEIAVASRAPFAVTLEEFASDHCLYFAGIFVNTDKALPQRAWPEETLKLYPQEPFYHPDVLLIGAIYLVASPFDKEVTLGLALLPRARGNGYARQALDCMLRWAFEDCGYHRVQVAIMDGPHRVPAMRLFAGAHFMHEGRRARQVVSPVTLTYQDVTYMGIVDTDWVIRRYRRDIPHNAWEELFERHKRERDALLEMDDSQLRRTASTETLKKEPDEDVENKKQNMEHSTSAQAIFGSQDSDLPSDWTVSDDGGSGSLGSSYDIVSVVERSRGTSPPASDMSGLSSSDISYTSDAEQPLLSQQ